MEGQELVGDKDGGGQDNTGTTRAEEYLCYGGIHLIGELYIKISPIWSRYEATMSPKPLDPPPPNFPTPHTPPLPPHPTPPI